MYDFYGRLRLPLCTTGNQSSRYDIGSCCSCRDRQMKLNPGGWRNTQWIVVFLKTQQSKMCFENEKHRVVQPATADARVLRLAAVCGDLPLQQRVIFTVSTIISTVDSYQYCSKPVVEWNKLHLKHHLPVWGLWPESETKSSKSNQKQEFSRNNPRIPSHLLSGAFGDLIRGKLMEWNSYAGQMDVLDTKWRENGCGFCVYMGKFLTCAFVVVLVGGKKTLS